MKHAATFLDLHVEELGGHKKRQELAYPPEEANMPTLGCHVQRFLPADWVGITIHHKVEVGLAEIPSPEQ